jgi:hypothetical protein
MATSLRLALPLTFALALGCDSGDGADEHAHEHETGEESETGHESDCEAETRDDEFTIGLSKSDDTVTVTFVAADPAPPAKGDNTWTVALTDAGGQTLANASVSAATPWMPDHDHGTPIEAIPSAGDNPGEFVITPVNLFMSGLWEVTLDIDTGAGTTEQVVFAFCVE